MATGYTETEKRLVFPPKELKIDGEDWYKTKQLMLGGYYPCHWDAGDEEYPIDYSYVGQLGLLGITNDEQADTPDLVLFTSRSAIPIADAVRGSFEEYGKPLPQLGIINCSERDQLPSSSGELRWKDEVKRLEALVDGIGNVTVVEQFVNKGYGIKYAKNILLYAGVDMARLRFMKGRWYHDIGSVSFDPITVTSGAAAGMRNIGRKSIARLG